MDPNTLLDYAVFQLTPTRTRCDLVVVSGKRNEKLASGLVDPFLSHLKCAKDQIHKGGYSITLSPPENGDNNTPWFTKATFQRFVRFVSSPEIIERVVQIEQEILQIESSVQSSEVANVEETGHQGEGNLSVADAAVKKSTNSSKSALEEDHGAEPRENSRVHFLRVMDTRKALLQKEQAMAYARAVVAGYEMDTIDDLICLADTFGASRLRAACADFKELYNKKHSDDQWMDELAAVQACPVADHPYMGTYGVMVADPLMRTSSEALSDSTTTANLDCSKDNLLAPEKTPNMQQQAPWMNQMPPYMYNFQQMPPYQGYPFPGLHPAQPYFQHPVGWSPPGDVIQSKNRRPSRKERSLDAKGTDASGGDEQTVSTDSDSETNSDEEEKHNQKSSSKGQKHVKKSNKKASKTVVIRNINYITSQRRNGEADEVSDNSSGEDLAFDEASIREGIDTAIASLEKRSNSKGRKSRGKHSSLVQNGLNGNAEFDGNNETDADVSVGGKTTCAWDAFQNLLMSHDDSAHPKDSYDEHLVVKDSDVGISHKSSNALHLESQTILLKSLTLDDSFLAIQRAGGNGVNDPMVDFANGENMNANMKKAVSEGEDALLSKHYSDSRNGISTSLPDFSSELSTIKNPKGEDWFIVNSAGGTTMQEAKQLEFVNLGSSYERDSLQKETTKQTIVVDDSFIIESRSTADESYISPWKTDIIVDADMDMASRHENGSPAIGMSGSAQPDDLCMVLVRESQESGSLWTPEMDYQAEISFNETDKGSSTAEANGHVKEPLPNGKNTNIKKNAGPATKNLARDAKSKSLSGPLARSKLDALSKAKRTSSASRMMSPKNKLEKEEEERRRMEELVIQRQKRIAERTAATGGLASPVSKKLPAGSKTSPYKLENNRTPSLIRRSS